MKVVDRLSEKMLPIVSKMSSQRHLLAIRDSFIVTMPLVMAASVMVLLNALIFSNATIQRVLDLSSLAELASIVNNGTMSILAIIVCYNIGWNLATHYIQIGVIDDPSFSPVHAGILSTAVMFILMPLSSTVTLLDGNTAEATGVFLQSLTSSSGLATAMIAALVSTELFIKLAKMKSFKIRMPEGVPPAVATSFNSLVPEIVVILFFSVVVFTLNHMTGLNVPQLIELAIQTPLKAFVLSVPGILFLQFFSDFLWVFGMHGSSILAPIRQAPLLQSIQENMDAFSVGKEIPNIITEPFTNAFGLIGGGGCILPLVIAILWASKRQEQRSIAKFGLTTCLFNITEPIMFGLPVVMNPIYMIPCAIIPSINLIIAYAATSLGIISKTVAAAPWITPPVIQSFIATGGDIRAAVLTVILIILDVFLFLPFVLAANKAKLAEGGY
ncbi:MULTISPECIES: PTS sugar transporter subunit IIC [Enterococcus]|uniref:PTS sugar transporter subunit IIC n=1 Tax=Enterococcus TaxID=1350 RepID=UPI0002A45E03|nr:MULTISPECIES: PTS transporter subunit EIIC [Enterococcus]EGO9936937.1 PTS sugar transporter subunit IIC [Enterococcus faecium]EGP5233819.1 PTS sugar transporter subunit IIC [Enterococcus faecium]ELB51000.1 PTS system, lactose/cellobiose family IIC component [Enterococcus faecium EnGen0038]EME3507965.1 PTS sugar transporter subunit IIC [Enterococcus faecium]EME3536675.1 PTS sugar transporter subunit IIC [Enterococcus faecium]